ncbi:MAG: lytic murein transglycosylase [Pseudomonadota bacterium]
MLRFLILAVALLSTPVHAQTRAAYQAQFRTWLDQTVWPLARRQGVSRGTFDTAFANVQLNFDIPGLRLPGQAVASGGQAEFRSPARYFRQDNLNASARIGRGLAGQYAQTLARIEQQSGVPGRILLAIWGRESGFGRVRIPHNVFQVLGTRAFFSEGDYMTSELIGALQVAQEGHVPVSNMRSSWAGALGQPQMMPRSFLAYAVDGDGDRRADIWGSQVDTLASIANFLKVHDWVPGRDWGFEITLPANVSCAFEGPDQARDISDWEAMGITRITGRPFPAHERSQSASLLMPAGRNGPAFLVTPNFYVIKRYNHSDAYALYIGHAADKIQYGVGPFRAGWANTDSLRRSDVAALQRGLEQAGFDVGGADGLAGYKTRRSIGNWQSRNGRPATCYPSRALVQALGR